MAEYKWLIGIDEAGRGPVAGPVSVGLFCICGELPEELRLDKDSKHLSAKKRLEWVEKIKAHKLSGLSQYSYSLVSNEVIDKKGITFAINMGIKKALERVDHNPTETRILLDGRLKAPKIYLNQETIIKGDETESVISLASVVAKVARDNFMSQIASQYPEYNFEKHKGYGTKEHFEKIRKNGMCVIHRRTFLSSIDKTI